MIMNIISKNIKRRILVALVMCAAFAGVFTSQTSYAQIKVATKLKLCGNYIIDKAAFKQTLSYEASRQQRPLAPNSTVRVYFHICQDDNGSNTAATEAQVKKEFNELIADFIPGNICFTSMGLNYVKNTTVNNNPTAALIAPYNIPNCLNIYYHNNMNGVGGSAWTIPSTFCSVTKANLGIGHSTTHEVGHCLGMLHTFEPVNGLEMINGSNATTSADLIADTKADPFVYNGSSCYKTSTCTYTGTCKDPNGATNYAPPYSNTMAYWPVVFYPGCIIVPSFTPNQFTRMSSFLTSNAGLISCQTVFTNYTLAWQTISSGYNWVDATNTVTTNGIVLINGPTITTMTGNLVSLQPGFTAIPSTGGLLLVRPSSCTAGSGIPKTNATLVTDSKPETEKLSVYPNPFKYSFELAINAQNVEKAKVSIYNSLGIKMKELSLINVAKGLNKINVDGTSLSKGIYLIEVRIGEEKWVKKVMKL